MKALILATIVALSGTAYANNGQSNNANSGAAVSNNNGPTFGGGSPVTVSVESPVSVAVPVSVDVPVAVAGGNATGGSSSASGGSSTASVTTQRSVPMAVAPGLAATNGACMGSSSIGASGVTFGLSIGSTWSDDACNRRYNAIRLQELGMLNASVALMCQDPTVAKAMKDAGTPCPISNKE